MRRSVFAWLVLLLVAPGALRAADAAPQPQQAETIIKNTAQTVLASINQDKQAYHEHPQKLYELVDKQVLPHVDATYMTRLALGRYWRQASDQQRKEITESFTKLLVRTYADTLLQYSTDQIHWAPVRADPDAQDVTVRSSVNTGSGSPVPMHYRLRVNDGQWQVYDVTVGGISLVTTYRSSFADLIQQQGMDGFIQTLRKKVAQATAKGS